MRRVPIQGRAVQEKARLAKKLMKEGDTQAPGAAPAGVAGITSASLPTESTPALTSKSPATSQLSQHKVVLCTEGLSRV